MYSNLHITVATVVERDQRFLMVEESSAGQVVFNQPAGHVEEGETLIEAAIRETQEESGWDVSIESLVGLYVNQAPHNGITYYRVCFKAKAVAAIANAKLDDGIIAAHWLSYEEITTLNEESRLRSPLVINCIDDFKSGASFPLSLIHDLR